MDIPPGSFDAMNPKPNRRSRQREFGYLANRNEPSYFFQPIESDRHRTRITTYCQSREDWSRGRPEPRRLSVQAERAFRHETCEAAAGGSQAKSSGRKLSAGSHDRDHQWCGYGPTFVSPAEISADLEQFQVELVRPTRAKPAGRRVRQSVSDNARTCSAPKPTPLLKASWGTPRRAAANYPNLSRH